ncbi:acetyl-CoA C-acetyltransferase [Klebsiella aerogenes]|uniref:acetyl-CoA C-acetyltransferase n=1 Tax=Klebsiella aerogenes TaxID=548 RepID=UPI001F2CC409|nr:acetyl-CoA C-acetyltransferase [Klebsiella aerogenes]
MLKDNDIVILDLARTAVGAFNGSLSGTPAVDMGAAVIQHLLKNLNLAPDNIDEVIIGQVLTAGCGQNPARQAAINAGIPENVSALTINKVCGSGLKALQLAIQAIRNEDARVVIAGGQENMSQAPHLLPHSRKGMKMGQWALDDSMVRDGLWDAFHHYHMGQTAENIAAKWNISREEQDRFAFASQQKAAHALNTHGFESEIVPIEIPLKRKPAVLFSRDEYPRPQTTLEALSTLSPAFCKQGSVTAGNASGINDGAAMVVLASARRARELGLTPLAVLRSVATAGVPPEIMGTGPIPASVKALKMVGWTTQDLDLIEANEAFAAQAIAVNKEMAWDTSRVNVNGGAIAIGHPVGASGARIFVTLVHEMKRRGAKKGLATLCIGGGMGIAATVEML